MKYLVLCPHWDDGPLSVGGLIQRIGSETTLLTVFSRTAWMNDRNDPGTVDEVSRLREGEERRAARILGVRNVDGLGLPEAPLRGHRSVFAKPGKDSISM